MAAFVGYVCLASLLFARDLARLVSLAIASDLNSHVPFVPLISVYLLYTQRPAHLPPPRTSLTGATMFWALAIIASLARVWFATSNANDALALSILAFVLVVIAGAILCFGAAQVFAAAFPVCFLFFMIPMPDAMANALEVASMRASADVAASLLIVTDTPLVRNGQLFALPGIVLHVAQECSGIRSSWVLFITSLLVSHLFLKSRWSQLALVVFVIPLGIVRNGFRILVIGLLCVHVGPEMIDSPIHHQGGPLFFVLSLGPLALFLWWLWRREH